MPARPVGVPCSGRRKEHERHTGAPLGCCGTRGGWVGIGSRETGFDLRGFPFACTQATHGGTKGNEHKGKTLADRTCRYMGGTELNWIFLRNQLVVGTFAGKKLHCFGAGDLGIARRELQHTTQMCNAMGERRASPGRAKIQRLEAAAIALRSTRRPFEEAPSATVSKDHGRQSRTPCSAHVQTSGTALNWELVEETWLVYVEAVLGRLQVQCGVTLLFDGA